MIPKLLSLLEKSQFKNKWLILFYFLFINLPLIILTFDTANFSDDFQYTNLWVIKARFSSLFPLIFEPIGGDAQGGHFVPVHSLFKYFITLLTIDPRFFHLMVLLGHVLTAFFVYLIVMELLEDNGLALGAGTFYTVNYYIGFKALMWNIFHAHATNTLTGAISLYFLLRYIRHPRPHSIIACCFFFVLTVLNFESGFVFLPVLWITLLYFGMKKKITYKRMSFIVLGLAVLWLSYPVGSYLTVQKGIPIARRLTNPRNIQNYAFAANKLLIHSTGLSIYYNKGIYNKYKKQPQLKEAMIKLIRGNDLSALREIPPEFLAGLITLGLLTIAAAGFWVFMICTRIRPEIRLVVWFFIALFFMYIFVFYRVDVANALALFTSILLAEILGSLLRDRNRIFQKIGIFFLIVYAGATLWSLADRFEDSYQESFWSLTPVALKGPERVYREMNAAIGHFAQNGIILFTHDYSPYQRTVGFERIGDLISIEDFVCYNATIFYPDLLKTSLTETFRHEPFHKFYRYLYHLPNNRRVTVNSLDEAIDFVKAKDIDLSQVDAVYLSPDYKVIYLNKLWGTSYRY